MNKDLPRHAFCAMKFPPIRAAPVPLINKLNMIPAKTFVNSWSPFKSNIEYQ